MGKKGRIVQPGGPVMDVTPEERARFKDLRKSKGMTQPQLAARIGVSDATISNIETGRSRQVNRTAYLAAMMVLQSDGLTPHAMRDERIKRILDKLMKIDERGLTTVEATIDAQLISLG
jgi:transcriptional regulator with XRE-family HTH domain